MDCNKWDIYSTETKLLFDTTKSDPCCLLPKTIDLKSWHIRYFKQFKIIPTLNNYLSIIDSKIDKLQSPKENIISESDSKQQKEDQHITYSTRHQKIALFTQIKNKIIGVILILTSTITGCKILSEYDVDLFRLFYGLNKNIDR